MLSNLILYRIASSTTLDLGTVEAALAKMAFQECGATQQSSIGWIPPRGEAEGALIESVGGHWILKFQSEVKNVPGEVLKRRVAEKAARILAETGRKPGKKESADLKQEALLDLLPMAFTRIASTTVWLDPVTRTLVVDATSQSRADDIVSLLVEAVEGMVLSLLITESSPIVMMSYWLTTQEPPRNFTVDRECELVGSDEAKAVVRYSRHPLDINEIREHIQAGKLPVKLALTWADRVSFVLTDSLQVRKVEFLEVAMEGSADKDGFDADVAIATGELCELIPDLLEALGGEQAATVTPGVPA